eukprot:g3425.t1
MSKLVILRAMYGPRTTPGQKENRMMRSRPITHFLRSLVRRDFDGLDILYVNRRFNTLFGDPAPGQDKEITIRYKIVSVGDVNREENNREDTAILRTFIEDQTIFLKAKMQRAVNRDNPEEGRDSTIAIRALSMRNGLTDILDINAVAFRILRFLPFYPDRTTIFQLSKRTSLVASACGFTDFSSRTGTAENKTEEDKDEDVDCDDKESNVTKKSKSVSLSKIITSMPGDFFVSMLESSCGQLIRLDLSDCVVIDSKFVDFGVENALFRKLRHLNLSGCARIDDDAIRSICENCQAIEMLNVKDLPNVTDASMRHVSKLESLVLLDISNCVQLGDATMNAISSLGSNRLITLHMRNVQRVTDAAVCALLKSSTHRLEELSLASMFRLTSNAFVRGFRRPCALSSLNLEGCWGLDDSAIIYVAESCHRLVDLNLSFCHRLGDSSLRTIGRCLSCLRFLSINYLKRVSDRGIACLAALQDLRGLDISHCDSLSGSSIVKLCSDLPFLNELRARYNPNHIDDDFVRSISLAFRDRARASSVKCQTSVCPLELLDLHGNDRVDPSVAKETLSSIALSGAFVECALLSRLFLRVAH